jgi:hypothetical protein
MSCWRISILRQSEAIRSISAPFVKTTMTFHSPRAMVATGPHGEISLRLPLAEIQFNAAWGGRFDARRSPGRGNAGASQVRDFVSGGDIANPTLGIALYIVKQPLRSRMAARCPDPASLTGREWRALSSGSLKAPRRRYHSAFRIPMSSDRPGCAGDSLIAERPSGSVHARVRRLQAIDRE